MPDNPRIEELRGRVQRDPSSIAFAQLGEEYRRAGYFEEAVQICRIGLARHPGYLSARVTLGRALIELSELDGAETELNHVLGSAPDNLAAIRGLADVYHRRQDLPRALTLYRRALALARHDPDLEQTVEDIERAIGSVPGPVDVPGGLSFAQASEELMFLIAEAPDANTRNEALDANTWIEPPQANVRNETLDANSWIEPPQAAAGDETLDANSWIEPPQATAGDETLEANSWIEPPQTTARDEALEANPWTEPPQANARNEALETNPWTEPLEANTWNEVSPIESPIQAPVDTIDLQLDALELDAMYAASLEPGAPAIAGLEAFLDAITAYRQRTGLSS